MRKKKTMSLSKPSKNTLDLLLKYEVGGGKNYYEKYLSKFTWPGGASGPTIAIGIDCAYYSKDELGKIFSFLTDKELELVKGSTGKTGLSGKEYTKILRSSGISVSWDMAVQIFEKFTWPKFSRLAEKTFPGLEFFPPDAYGVIVSLIFNRGTSLKGDSRLEMRNIKNLVPKRNYKSIAREIRKMKRLWVNKNLDGLLERREAEARRIEQEII